MSMSREAGKYLKSEWRIKPFTQFTTTRSTADLLPSRSIKTADCFCVDSRVAISSFSRPTEGFLQVIKTVYQGRKLIPDDMIFDHDGNAYFTSYEGDPQKPAGGIYRLEAGTNSIDRLSDRVGNANGISLSPDGKILWVAETLATLTVQKFDLEKGEKADGQLIPSVVYRFIPHQGWPDSNAVDVEGNIYQAMAESGRVVVMSPQGVGLAKIVIPTEFRGGYQRTYNLAFKPGTNTGYITASGKNGGAIFTFKASACGLPLFSHDQAGGKAIRCDSSGSN